jgi:hypothetical protein
MLSVTERFGLFYTCEIFEISPNIWHCATLLSITPRFGINYAIV